MAVGGTPFVGFAFFTVGGRDAVDKGKIRMALAALSVAGLLAGVTMTGCRSAGSCTGSSTMDPNKSMQNDSGSSCGATSCSGTMAPKSDKPAAK
jgi:radical SAM modification target selenobiotic family peptide